MKIQNDRELTTLEAFNNPQVGDYWSEHFCPYFVIVKIDGNDFYVLSAMGGAKSYNRKHELNARVDEGGEYWRLDYPKHRKAPEYTAKRGMCFSRGDIRCQFNYLNFIS